MRIKELFFKYKEILLYIIFGAVTTLINFLVYSVLVEFFGAEMTLSNGIAWIFAITFAFITNKLYVFESRNFKYAVLIKEILTFLSSRIFSGIVEIIMPTLLYNAGIDGELFGIKGFIAKIIVNIIVIILNYVFSKLFVFKK